MKTKNKLNLYVAAGWFTPTQLDTYTQIHNSLDEFTDTFDIYYPKENFQINSNTIVTKNIRQQVYTANLNAIKNSDIVICSTEGKDMGSIMEAGFAIALKKLVIYCCFSLGNNPFNLMLQESAIAVARDQQELESILFIIKKQGLKSNKLQTFLYYGKTE